MHLTILNLIYLYKLSPVSGIPYFIIGEFSLNFDPALWVIFHGGSYQGLVLILEPVKLTVFPNTAILINTPHTGTEHEHTHG